MSAGERWGRPHLMITTPSFPPDSGGVAEAAHRHALGLAGRGYWVTVITGAGATPDPEHPRLRVIRIPVAGTTQPGKRFRGDLEAYRRLVRTFDGEILFCHCWHAWNTELAVDQLHNVRAYKVLVSHGVSANSHVGLRGWVYWLLGRPYVWQRIPRVLAAFDELVVLSRRRDRDRFLDHSLAARAGRPRVTVIPNGAERGVDRVSGGFAERHGLVGKRIVLCVGKFHRLKNEAAVVRAFLRAAPRDSALVVLGPSENGYARRLRRIASRSRSLPSSSRVLVLTALGAADIRGAYRDAHLFVSASRTECLPLVILDAMASGVPFVSTPVGCVEELPGGLVANREREIAACISRLLEDGDLHRTLAEAGRRAANETYSWERVVAQYQQLVDARIGQAREVAP